MIAKKKVFLTTMLLFVFIVPVALLAQNVSGQYFLGLYGSPIKLVGDTRDDCAVRSWEGVRMGTYFSPRVGLELSTGAGYVVVRDYDNDSFLGKYFKQKPDSPYRTYLYPISVNLVYNFITDSRWKPYAVFGGSVLFWELRSKEGSSTRRISHLRANAMGNLGAGIEYFINQYVSLDLGLRSEFFFDQKNDMSGYGDIQSANIEFLRATLTFYMGGQRQPKPLVDSDNDGINDDQDKCPFLAEDFDGFEDDDGCPDNDNDGDGIPDNVDKCPNKAETFNNYLDDDGCPDSESDRDGDGISDTEDDCPTEREDIDGFEDEDGCPDPDNDRDNIPDGSDKCPNEPETYNDFEDDDGCPDEKPEIVFDREAPIVLEGVNFATGSANLTEDSKIILNKVVETLNSYPEMKLEISGHTDNVGSRTSNRTLSLRRAESVRNFLVNQGIEGDRLTTVGYGPDRPLESNNNAEGRAKNRRIEFRRID
ncbi:OmpA family protein [bacterium]|nr:OmpA family protein [bacterium]